MRWWTRLFGGSGSGDAPATAQERRDEQLSAYLDGELAPADAAALERALAVDAGLHAELEGLRAVRDALRSLGEARAPRAFTLAVPPAPLRAARLPRIELATRLATVTAAALLVAAVALPGGGERIEAPAAREVGLALPGQAPAATLQAAESAAPAAQPTAAKDAAAPSPPRPQAAPRAQGTPQRADAPAAASVAPAAAPAAAPVAAAAPTAQAVDAGAAAPAAQPAGVDQALDATPAERDGDLGRRPLAAALAVATALLATLALAQWWARRRAARSA